MGDPTPEEMEERFRAMFPGEELPYPHREKIVAFHLSEIRVAVAANTERIVNEINAFTKLSCGWKGAIIGAIRRATDPSADEEK